MRTTMRKVLLTAAAAVTAFAAMPAAGAQAATTVESVIGTGTLGQFGTPTAYLAAAGNQRGQLGAFTITYPDGTYATGASSCLVVDGKTAYLTGRIVLSGGPRRDTNSWQRGNYVVIGVRDDGDGTVVADKLNFSPGTAADPGCGPYGAASPDFFIVKGNYRVTDAG
ncbi:hypothetical protein ACQP2F_25520 [Actinoplanes sp. CA-030573]|uniref:hypothetical protein n=1 Tax=Actinoplanes sp. CA-030573 TaxID=3239898 RepID=UPI003D93BAB3